jgi:hypothetical protein
LITLNELAYAVAAVGGSGAVLLGDDERIPADRIVGFAKELLEEQRGLSKVIEGWLAEAE